MKKNNKSSAWDSGQPVDEAAIQSETVKTQIKKRRRKLGRLTARHYFKSYKTLLRQASPALVAALHDPSNYSKEVRDFCEAICAHAEAQESA